MVIVQVYRLFLSFKFPRWFSKSIATRAYRFSRALTWVFPPCATAAIFTWVSFVFVEGVYKFLDDDFPSPFSWLCSFRLTRVSHRWCRNSVRLRLNFIAMNSRRPVYNALVDYYTTGTVAGLESQPCCVSSKVNITTLHSTFAHFSYCARQTESLFPEYQSLSWWNPMTSE